jgi:hypothetical protein
MKSKWLLILSFGALSVMWIGFETHLIFITYFSAGVMGLFIFPFLTTIIDLASQSTFPIG